MFTCSWTEVIICYVFPSNIIVYKTFWCAERPLPLTSGIKIPWRRVTWRQQPHASRVTSTICRVVNVVFSVEFIEDFQISEWSAKSHGSWNQKHVKSILDSGCLGSLLMHQLWLHTTTALVWIISWFRQCSWRTAQFHNCHCRWRQQQRQRQW